MAQQQVKIIHPEYGFVSTVLETSVPAWEAKGWVRAEDYERPEAIAVEDLEEESPYIGWDEGGYDDEE